MGRKLTTDEFILKAKEIHGDKYDYSLVEYDGKYNKVKIFCKLCNNYFFQSPIHHYLGHGCSICNGKTLKDFIQKSKEIHGDKYDYSLVNIKDDKIKIICPKHGIFEQNKYLHKNGSICPKCSIDNKKNKIHTKFNNITFIQKSKDIHGDKYDYSLVDYKNIKTKVKIICPIHGTFEQTPDNHIKGCDCYMCKSNNNYNIEKFISKANEIHQNRYNYSLVNYINNRIKIKIVCSTHGIFEQTPNSHLSGNGCNFCYRENNKKTTDEFINDANIIHNNKYDYSLIKYENNFKKIKIICPSHGVFEQAPNTHLNKKGCPKCKSSKGELMVEKYLMDHNINYIKQKTYNGCVSKNNNKLKFDFFIEDYNSCIEFDGIQHFIKINYWGGEEGFKNLQKRDQIKNEYCKNNNIRLIRIKYDDDIENKLNKELFNI
jgi:hypothetical protein